MSQCPIDDIRILLVAAAILCLGWECRRVEEMVLPVDVHVMVPPLWCLLSEFVTIADPKHGWALESTVVTEKNFSLVFSV